MNDSVGNDDACTEMLITDAIEKSKTDKIVSALDWLTQHGFIARTTINRVQFVRGNFQICGMMLDLMVEYNIGDDFWTCEAASDSMLWEGVDRIVLQSVNSDGKPMLPPVIEHGSLLFNSDVSRIFVMSNRLVEWIKSFKAGNYLTPREALESYCRRLVMSVEIFKVECGKHSREWWLGGYLTGRKIDYTL
jgi:hypothetical protein